MKKLTAKFLFVILASVTLAMSCSNPSNKEKSSSDSAEETGWSELFNGENLDGWYTYQRQPEPTSEVAGLARDEQGNYLEPIGLNNDPLNVSSVYNIDANNLIDGNDFYLSFYGTDPEFNVVTLEASLISKPSGSITTLNLHPLSFSFPDSYFITPDLAGEYIIEVLATDGDGVSAIRNYTINASFN